MGKGPGKPEKKRTSRQRKLASQARITRGEDPTEGGPDREHDHTDGTQRDDNCGDKGIIGFWKERQMTIFDVRITDVTAKSYRDCLTNLNLQKWENLKKKKHIKACLETCLEAR